LDDIFILPSDHRAAAALRQALDPPHRVRTLDEFSELQKSLRAASPQACILDVFDPRPGVSLDHLRRLRHEHPTVALVVAADFSGREMELYSLGRIGIDGIIRLEETLPSREILTVVNRAITASLANRVILGTATDLPPLAQGAIRWAIEHADSKPRVSELAAALSVSHRTLVREVRSWRLESPRTLLIWGRLIRGAHLLERPGETVESAAFHLGYSTGGAFGKALKRHTGCSPSELLERGGLAWALEVFQRQAIGATGQEIEPWTDPEN
jgi:AraC-like DNA-binding protein